MKILLLTFAMALLASTPTQSQETEVDDKKVTDTEPRFAWLKKFEGRWDVVAKEPGSDDVVATGTVTSKVLGGQWIVNEHNSQMGSMKFTAVQTIGYDRKKKEYRGNWIDSISDYKWSYAGNVTDEGNEIILNAEGPDWKDSSKHRKYRDRYVFKNANQIHAVAELQNEAGVWEAFMTSDMTKVSGKLAKPSGANQKKVTPFLMFEGQSLAAIELYQAVFDDVTLKSLKKYGAGEAGKEGTVYLAELEIEGQLVKFVDSPVSHDFAFTPSFSFFVTCDSVEQLQTRFDKLADGGKVMMPVGEYGFSKKFAWTSDKFGVSWQLSVE